MRGSSSSIQVNPLAYIIITSDPITLTDVILPRPQPPANVERIASNLVMR